MLKVLFDVDIWLGFLTTVMAVLAGFLLLALAAFAVLLLLQ